MKISKKDLKVFSQRDERWADETLGTKGTVGNLGCVIACIGSVSGLTPSEVNKRLKSVDGYFDGNLVIWGKIKEAIPWLEWTGARSREYDNDRVLRAIENYGFCLVEVDASRIGAPKHWVVYLGNQEMFDPWYGNFKSTSYYRPVGFSELKRMDNKPEELQEPNMYGGLDLNNKESMKICVDEHNAILAGEYIPKEKVEEMKQDYERDIKKWKTKYETERSVKNEGLEKVAEKMGGDVKAEMSSILAEVDYCISLDDQLDDEREKKREWKEKYRTEADRNKKIIEELSKTTGYKVKTEKGVSRALSVFENNVIEKSENNKPLSGYDTLELIIKIIERIIPWKK